jgi:hypothetical protein
MALNGTFNVTVNSTFNATNSSILTAERVVSVQSFVPLVFSRLWDLIAAPFRHGEMLWIILPLFFTLIVMEIYYDRHRDEELGWGSALANSLVLVFVAIDLIKTSFDHATPWEVFSQCMVAAFTDASLEVPSQVVLLILFLGVLGIAVTIINYFHLLPRKMMYVISGHPPINFLAYFAIAIVYSTGSAHEIPFDMATLIAGALLFVILCLIVFGIKKIYQRLAGDIGNQGNQGIQW